MALNFASNRIVVADTRVDQRARALVQHQRVLDEAAQVAQLGAQARRRAAAVPVFATPGHSNAVRQRVNWVRAS